MSEKQAKTVFLSIGSNLGEKKKNIEEAKFRLEENNIKIIKSSKFYETLSWPNNKNPKFINIVLKVKTLLSPKELLKICFKIENELGRIRKRKNEPRTCDIDIIDYQRIIIKKSQDNDLILPHPRMHKRNFVLLPLFEIEKTWIHPTKKENIKKLVISLKPKDLNSVKLT